MRQPPSGRRLESWANLSTSSSRNFTGGVLRTYVPDSCAAFILSSSASTGSGRYYYRRFIGEERLGDLSNLAKVTSFSGELNLGPSNNKKERFKHFGGLSSLCCEMGRVVWQSPDPCQIHLRESLDSSCRALCSLSLQGKVLFENTRPPLLA